MPGSVSAITTSVAVAAHIRERIHSGDYGLGDRLPPQRVLAERLRVARVSVQEGIRQLVAQGYLEVRRGASGGAFVTGLEKPLEAWRRRLRSRVGELDELIDFRIAVEGRVAYLAAQRRTRSELTMMRNAIRVLEDIRAGEGDNRQVFRSADSKFHFALSRAAHNERLDRALREARVALFTPYDLLEFDEPVHDVTEDHQAIYLAVRDADPSRAERLMAEHVAHTREQLLSFIVDTA